VKPDASKTGTQGVTATIRARRERRRSAAPAVLPIRPIRNSVLAALLAAEYNRVLPKLDHVMLRAGQTLYRAEQDIEDVYFPEEAVVAMIDSTDQGRTVEVGIIGREGIVGLNVFLGGVTTPDKAVVQLAGGATRMRAQDLRNELRFGSPLQQLLLSYARTFLAAISQSVACSQHHDIEQRLARLLLTLDDYAVSGEFSMPQASIAPLLGVRRAGVSGAAHSLQALRLISYRRGRIRILERRGLEKKSCECYRFIRRQYAQFQAVPPQLSSRR
jgi:CRP-like cAMP-binding protein